MNGETYEILCARFGHKELNCPLIQQGGNCVECSNSRYRLREKQYTEEPEEEKENTNDDGE